MFALLTLMVDIFVCRNSSTFSEITKIFLFFFFFFLFDRSFPNFIFIFRRLVYFCKESDRRSIGTTAN